MSKVDKITSFRQKQFFESSPTSRAISEMLIERSKQAALVVDGAKYAFRRPRVRNENGEVELETLKKLRDQDLFDETNASRMTGVFH
ncbi:MAG: hypothetical protein EBZ49_03140 [Proteobacteria bacterium]|nr:hypothetical protein [Pseudomonadota bacterium]